MTTIKQYIRPQEQLRKDTAVYGIHQCISMVRQYGPHSPRRCFVYTRALSQKCCYHSRYPIKQTEQIDFFGRLIRCDLQNKTIESEMKFGQGITLAEEL
jgi:hypothetical protein